MPYNIMVDARWKRYEPYRPYWVCLNVQTSTLVFRSFYFFLLELSLGFKIESVLCMDVNTILYHKINELTSSSSPYASHCWAKRPLTMEGLGLLYAGPVQIGNLTHIRLLCRWV